MAQGKYAKYVTELGHIPDLVDTTHAGKLTLSLLYNKDVCKEATHYFESFIVYAPGACLSCGYNISYRGKEQREMPAKRSVDGMFLLFGTDPKDPIDLGGEVECWLGEGEAAEKYTITKSTCVTVPAGLVQGPVYFRRVDRPFIFIAMASSPSGMAELVDKLPPGFSPQD